MVWYLHLNPSLENCPNERLCKCSCIEDERWIYAYMYACRLNTCFRSKRRINCLAFQWERYTKWQVSLPHQIEIAVSIRLCSTVTCSKTRKDTWLANPLQSTVRSYSLSPFVCLTISRLPVDDATGLLSHVHRLADFCSRGSHLTIINTQIDILWWSLVCS